MWLWPPLLVGGALIFVLWELLAAMPVASPLAGLRLDMTLVFHHAEGHWQTFAALFLNACVWAGVPAFLRWRRTGSQLRSDEWALFGLLGLVLVQYACRYSAAAGSTEPLLLLAGIWITSMWRVLLPAAPVRSLWPWLWLGAFGLACVSLWDWPMFPVFGYREARRATGLWNNPNTYGLLAACSAAMCLVWLIRLAPWRRPKPGLLDSGMGTPPRTAWLLILPLLPALGGLVRSYSRGAWLGFLVALMWCGWWLLSPVLRPLRADARAGVIPARRRWLAFRLSFVALLAGGVVSLWFLKDFQNPLLRRVGTVANHTDRSWRNRVDAWIGAARMTVARPLTGWGLNRVEAGYAREFKPAHLKETAAIQLNDYLKLAAGMGVPAVGLFLVLVVSRLRLAHRERNPNVAPLLVLLVGCWFDGVLFRLSLAVPFWLLLLAGTRDLPTAFAPVAVLRHAARGLAGTANKWLRVVRPAMPTEKLSKIQLLRRGIGFAVLALLIGYVYWPDIPGGFRYRLDPWVRQAAGVVAGQTGTAAKADSLHEWLHTRNRQEMWSHEWFGRLDWATAGARGGCRTFCETYAEIANALGLRVRPVYTFWPTIGNPHYWVEIWDVENQRWRPCDVSAYERTWDTPWMHRVPKAVSLVPTAEPGSWAAHDQWQWEFLENTIGAHYPSGQVEVTVLEREQPLPGARVEVQVWLGNGMGGKAAGAYKFVDAKLFSVLAGRTDTNGLVRFTLGRSAKQPYRIRFDRPGDADWAWVAVNSNSLHQITLRADRRRPYDLKAPPPRMPLSLDEE